MLYLLSRGVEKFSIVSGGVHHQYHYCLGGYLAGNDVQGVKSTQLLIHRGCILIKWNSPLKEGFEGSSTIYSGFARSCLLLPHHSSTQL